MTRTRLLLPLATAALLAGCGEEPASDDGRAASGEVLEGTISDAMLPLDTLRSQPPLIAPAPARRNANGGAEDAADAVETEAARPAEDANEAEAAAATGSGED